MHETSAAPFTPSVLAPAAADDNAAPQAPAAATATAPLPTIDQHNFMHWDVLNMDSIPIAALNFDTAKISTNRFAHATLLLFFLSDELEHAVDTEDEEDNAVLTGGEDAKPGT